jgi:hypothetical protein
MQGGENNVPDELTSNGRKSLSGLFYCNIANNLVRTSLHALLPIKKTPNVLKVARLIFSPLPVERYWAVL